MSSENKTIDVREGEELDISAIDSLLKDHIDGLSGDAEVRQFASGHSNLTYAITYGDKHLVLRRPPFGTKPKSGHSMIREFRVMNALKPKFPAVPETYFHMPAEESLLGAEFYVMEQVMGAKVDKEIPEEWGFSEDQTRKLGLTFFDRLIDLHSIDPDGVGLGDFGKAEGYVERQIKGWNGRFERALTDDVEDFADVRQWLEDNMPADSGKVSVLHGDYRLDNVILDAENPFNIKAVLDWEISALGDPLMDLGNTLAYWIEADDPQPLLMTRMQPSHAPGMPTRKEIVGIYGEKTGIDVSGFDYYLIYGTFRLAVIVQQIYFRYKNGQSKNKAFAGFGQMANLLGYRCRDLISKV